MFTILKDMWAGALSQIFTGNALEQYYLHVDAFSGNYEGLKRYTLSNMYSLLFSLRKLASDGKEDWMDVLSGKTCQSL